MRPCGYCGSSSFVPLVDGVTDRLGQVDGEFSFLSCAKCESAWLNPLPEPGELSSFYPRIYGLGKEVEEGSRLAALMSALELALWFGPVYRRNARMLSNCCNGKGSLLEVGCGSGYQAACYRRYGFDVTGVDFADGTAEWMNAKHGIQAYSCDVSQIHQVLAGRQFDAVAASHVIEHMLEPRKFLEILSGCMRAGGQVFLTMPLVDSFQARMFGKHWGAFREAPRHVNMPSKLGLSLLFEQAGLEAVAIKPDHIYYEAGSAFASLSGRLSMTASYGSKSAFVSSVKRFIGAGLAVCYLPVACVEILAGSYSMGSIIGRKRCA